jgi:site-specific DNA-methyltransferase (adenine-specific)
VPVTWDLFEGSCLDAHGLSVLPDKSVAATICDPPYESEAHAKGKRQVTSKGGRRAVADAPLSFAPMTEADRDAVAVEIGRITTQCALVFCQVEAVERWRASLERGGMKYRRAIPWVKPDAMPSLHGRWPGQAVEMIVLATAAKARKLPIGGKAVYYTFPRCQDGLHETGKPLRLMESLVLGFSRPGDVVVDPYAGSGTTLLAARMHGRHGIGWEIDPAVHEVARRRLSGEDPRPNPKQVHFEFQI